MLHNVFASWWNVLSLLNTLTSWWIVFFLVKFALLLLLTYLNSRWSSLDCPACWSNFDDFWCSCRCCRCRRSGGSRCCKSGQNRIRNCSASGRCSWHSSSTTSDNNSCAIATIEDRRCGWSINLSHDEIITETIMNYFDSHQ